MELLRAVVLTVLGLCMALLVFPVALYVSAGLGYAMGVAAIAIGSILIAKRGESNTVLALGATLLVVATISTLGTAMVHLGLWATNEVVKGVDKVKTIHAEIGKDIIVDNWVIRVVNVEEAKYVVENGDYYKARNGSKIVIIKLRIANIGNEVRSTSDIWNFVLVTNLNHSYDRVYAVDLEPLWSTQLNKTIEKNAAEVNELLTTSIAPRTAIEKDILFQIPTNEEPMELYFKVGIIGGYQIVVDLRK